MLATQPRHINNLPNQDFMGLLFTLVEQGLLDTTGNVTPLGEEYISDEYKYSFERMITNRWAGVLRIERPASVAPESSDAYLKVTVLEGADEQTAEALQRMCENIQKELADKGIRLNWRIGDSEWFDRRQS